MSITLASVPAFSSVCASAHRIDLSAYTLRTGAVCAALIAAAERGARVRVRLEGDPLDDAAGTLHAANAESIAALEAAGADAAPTGPQDPVLHMKAAVVDGVAWLDDRNWSGEGPETVVRDSDADDVAAVSAGLARGYGRDAHLATTKGPAQYLEADIIARAGNAALALESESFGTGTIYDALLHRARAGLPTRLLVAGREALALGKSAENERRRLSHLQSLGVEVRTGDPRGRDFDEKIAVTTGAAWVGSTNATYARGDAGRQRDWGMATRRPALVDGLSRAFERNWRDAAPFTGAGSATNAVHPADDRR